MLFWTLSASVQAAQAGPLQRCPLWLAYWVYPATTQKIQTEILAVLSRQDGTWMQEQRLHRSLLSKQIYVSPRRFHANLDQLQAEGSIEKRIVNAEGDSTAEEFRMARLGWGRRERLWDNGATKKPWFEVPEWSMLPQWVPVPIPIPVRQPGQR